MTLAPFHALAGRALSSIARHALLYLVLVVAIVACFALALARWKSPAAEPAVDFIAIPALDTVVIAVAFADLRGERSASAVWQRVLDRVWATITIGFVSNIVAVTGVASLTGGFVDKLYAIFFLLLSAAIVYAPIFAVTDDATPWWLLVWRSFGASVRTALHGPNFSRAMLLLAVQFIPFVIGTKLPGVLAAHHVAHGEFWANAVVGTFLEPPIVALVAFTYFDAAGVKPSDACSE